VYQTTKYLLDHNNSVNQHESLNQEQGNFSVRKAHMHEQNTFC
jgi:hypothetical protein